MSFCSGLFGCHKSSHIVSYIVNAINSNIVDNQKSLFMQCNYVKLDLVLGTLLNSQISTIITIISTSPKRSFVMIQSCQPYIPQALLLEFKMIFKLLCLVAAVACSTACRPVSFRPFERVLVDKCTECPIA